MKSSAPSYDRLDLVERGDDHDRQIVDAAVRFEPLKHAEPVELRHHDIEKHEIEIPAFDRRQGLDPVGRLLDLADAEALQPAHQQVSVLRHVIDDQHRGGRRVHAGTRSAHPAASARMSMSIIVRAGRSSRAWGG
jgi:hypothetical protein